MRWTAREGAAVPGVLAAHRAAAAGVAGADRGGIVEHVTAAGAASSLVAPTQALHRLEFGLQWTLRLDTEDLLFGR